MEQFNRSMTEPYSGTRPESVAQPRVLVIGPRSAPSHRSLIEGLAQRRCQVDCCTDGAALDESQLAGVSLVFVFVASLATDALLAPLQVLLRQTTAVSVIPIVEYADQHRCAALLEAGCVDYLLSPFGSVQLDSLLQRQAAAAQAGEHFVCCSRAGRRLLAMAQRVANSPAPVLISGETGTGKELLARYIHRFAHAARAPFVAVNCAAIPEQMLESLLFGHERGAFTGAVTAQPGKFELANGGTLLLDEIGELPLGLQAKLLRVLQERRVERLGARKDIELNVRVIAATNRDLVDEVAQGRFRADLMFRLDVLALHIPPLRERVEDILPLARRFIADYAPLEPNAELLTDAACRALLLHPWPGNVRELENTLQRALVLRNGLFIQPLDLGLEGGPQDQTSPAQMAGPAAGKAALRASGQWAEYQHVLEALRKFDGHKSKAAQSLGMTPRALRYRLSAMREQGVLFPGL